MGYSTSTYSAVPGATIRYLDWPAETGELYPDTFDNRWRFVKTMSIVVFKGTALSARDATVDLVRENFTPVAPIWRRFYLAADVTTDPTFLRPNEQMSASNLFMALSPMIIGSGLLMPPRSQIRVQLSSTDQFNVTLGIIIVEADNPEILSQFL